MTAIVKQTLADVIGEVEVGPETDLLSVGSDSIVLMTVASRIKAATGLPISLEALFTHSTIGAICRLLVAGSSAPVSPGSTNISELQEDLTPLPLSAAEQRFWLLDSFQARAGAYNILHAIRLRGNVNKPLLEVAVNSLISRYDLLRTEYDDALPRVKRIHESAPISLRYVDLRGLTHDGQKGTLEQALAAEVDTPFSFSTPPLLRATLFQTGPAEYALTMCAHHVICDAWSLTLMMQHVVAHYRAGTGGAKPLEAAPLQYRSYVIEQMKARTPQRDSILRSFWNEQLSGDIAAIEIPGMRYGRDDVMLSARTVDIQIDGTLRLRLREYCQTQGASIFMLFLATLAGLISRLSQQEDFVICAPIAERTSAGAAEVIGCLLNTLPLRVDVSGDPSMNTLLTRTKTRCLAAYAHQDLPFEEILEVVRADGRHSRSPLSQVFLNFLATPSADWSLPQLEVEELQIDSVVAKEPLAIYVKEKLTGITLQFVWQEALYEEGRIETFADQFRELLIQAVDHPERPIRDHSLITPSTLALLADPNESLGELGVDTCISMFENVVSSHPDAPAVIVSAQAYSYSDLSKATARIAATISQSEGVRAGEVVAVYGRRSFGLIAAMLGVLSARAVLLTISKDTHPLRVKEMLEQAGATRLLLISDAFATAGTSHTFAIKTIRVTERDGAVEMHEGRTQPGLLPRVRPEDPAYVFFTSGTTGKPKGILGQHRGLAHFLSWQKQQFKIGPGDRAGQLTNLNFDVVLRDVLTALTSGAALCLPDDEDDLTADAVFPWLRERSITYFHTVPTLARAWLLSKNAVCKLKELRFIFFAGEQLPGSLVEEVRQRIREDLGVVNLYGPTETTLAK